MPRLFVPPDQLGAAEATLDESAYRHLIKVLRLGPGDPVCIFDGTGTEIDACIASVGRANVVVTLGQRRRLPPPTCAITLLVSPPRSDRMDLVVQKTTELGVTRIVPVISSRTVVKLSSHQSRRWQVIAQEAARQSGRADVPPVDEPVALDQALASAAATHHYRWMLWEEERRQSLQRSLTSDMRTVALLIGPEGGFSPEEAGRAVSAGFTPVGLGPRILRSETAAIVTVALVQAVAGGLE